jgi:hypothetical protein
MHLACTQTWVQFSPTQPKKERRKKYVVFLLNWVFFSTLFLENELFEIMLIQLVLVQDFISTYLYVECYGVQEK